VVTTRRGVGAYRWELALVAVTAVWGSTFVLVRDAVAQIPPFTFIAYRFLAAALLLAAIRPRLAAELGGRQPAAPGRPRIDGNQS
jgi:drug/metabolite transporter (DMT)-like permease